MNEDDYGVFCERRGCEHTRAMHLNGECDFGPDGVGSWCKCPAFLDPDFDDEPEARLAAVDVR